MPCSRRSTLLKDAGAIVKEVVLPHAYEAKFANQIIINSESFAYHHDDLGSMYDTYGIYTSSTSPAAPCSAAATTCRLSASAATSRRRSRWRWRTWTCW